MVKIEYQNVTQSLVIKGYWNTVLDIVLGYKLR